VAFLDSDDLWFDFKLDLQVALLGALPNLAYLFSEFVILKDDGKRIRNGSRTWLTSRVDWSALYPHAYSAKKLGVRVPGAPDDFSVYSGGLYRNLLHEAFVLPTTAIVRRSAIGSLKFAERVKIFEDWEFFAQLARNHEGGFMDVETAINRGHDNADRLTRCSALSKAQCYLAMLERVWKKDAVFSRDHAATLRDVESEALLAVAREAVLAAQSDIALDALGRWREIAGQGGRSRERTYRLLANLPGGRYAMRGGLLCRTVARNLKGSSSATHPVNPAA
jgi:hypothetical protein